ncbi:uncharacterized protein [Drosophila kikkawai]|uniref:Endonuclease/exonuclease/phosphatase domain-containing protein n=1 Tax=Drosophila kikkawai TaxID=30033 RepID=A0ABM4GBC5_DROKI
MAKFQGTTIYSCYLVPSLHTDEFREIVQETAQNARGQSPVIIAGFFNAWSTAWGSTRTTQRGTIILDAFSTLDVCLLNDGRRCTFSKPGHDSYIDLTFASPKLTRNSYWEVTHLLTYSDHAAIVFHTRHNQPHQTNRETAYRVHTLNPEVLLSSMDANTITGEANTCADVISARIKAACDAAMEKSTKGGGRRPVPWWNQEIARQRCQRSRGRTTRGGFKKYCLVCTLDVKNAFNSANWSLILQALQRGGISGYIIQLIADYFKDRVLLYSSDAGNQRHHVTGGVPQTQSSGHFCGTSYDIALVTVEEHLSDVSTKCSHAIDILMSWIAYNGLSLAEQKTEAVLISSRKVVEKVNFRCHLEYAAAKASKATAAISRMMANTRGPRQHSRRLISTVVTSTLLYAAPIWAEAMLVASYSRQCRTVYRRCALCISSCFCTVSEEAALVVAGSIPTDLLAAERRTGNSGIRIQRSISVARWQARWDNALDAGHIGLSPIWTSGYTDVTGKFKHEADPSCDYCGGASVEDAEHTFFECPLFRAEREAAEATTNRRLTPETMIGCMLETPSNWDAVTDMAATVMRKLFV